MINIKVYFHDWGVDHSLVLYSKELGWMEYFDEYDTYSPLVFSSKKEMICNTWNAHTDEERIKQWSQEAGLTYLGDL